MKAVFSQFLGGNVELSTERFLHIQERHPGTLPDYELELQTTIANPDLIRQSEKDTSAWLFSKWFTSIRKGRFLIVIIIAEANPQRFWVVTAYTARKITGGITAWKKP
jgi:hypothetical protein